MNMVWRNDSTFFPFLLFLVAPAILNRLFEEPEMFSTEYYSGPNRFTGNILLLLSFFSLLGDAGNHNTSCTVVGDLDILLYCFLLPSYFYVILL